MGWAVCYLETFLVLSWGPPRRRRSPGRRGACRGGPVRGRSDRAKRGGGELGGGDVAAGGPFRGSENASFQRRPVELLASGS